MIHKINATHLKSIVDIHLSVYSEKHFTSFFPKSLLLNYYQLILDNSDYAIMYKRNQEIIGFLFAGQHINQGSSILRNKKYFVLIKLLLQNPSFIFSYLKSFIISFYFQSNAKFRLLSVAVNKNHFGDGTASIMITNLEEFLVKSNITHYGLSVKTNNVRALKFYNKMGFNTEFSAFKIAFLIKYL